MFKHLILFTILLWGSSFAQAMERSSCPQILSELLAKGEDLGEFKLFQKALSSKNYTHPLLSDYSSDYIERMHSIITRINEWQKDEFMYYAFKHLKYWRKKLKKLPELGESVIAHFPDGSFHAYDPRVSELYWYGYPEVGLRNPELFTDYLNQFGKNSIMTSVYKSGGLDGGYDIESLTKVRRSVGGNKAYKAYLDALNLKQGAAVHDFILPHSSPANKELKLNNFLYLKEMPEVVDRDCSTGVCFIKYRLGDKEWSIELDDANQAGLHFAPYLSDSGDMVYTMHYFKENQFVLNNFNPETWNHHFKAIGNWLSQGVSIMRLDAVFFMASRIGKESIGNESSRDMIELVQLFSQGLRPGMRIINEAVGGIELAHKYIGKSVEVGEKKIASHGNMDFAFEISNRLKFGMVLGDFKGIYDTFKRLKQVDYPEDYFSLLITASHDHEAHGFLPKEQWKNVREIVKQRGGISNYSEPNSVIRNADLLKRNPNGPVDPKRMKMMFKAFLGMGNTAIYYGDEFGKTTEISFAYKKASEMLATRKKLLKTRMRKYENLSQTLKGEDAEAFLKLEKELIDKEESLLKEATLALVQQDKTIAPDKESVLYKSVFDPRWVKRGDVSIEKLQQLMNGQADSTGQEIFNSLKLLQKRRKQSKALFLKHDVNWIDSYRDDIASWVNRFKDRKTGEIDEVAVFVNPNANERTVTVHHLDQLTHKVNNLKKLRFMEVEGQKYLEEGVDYSIENGKLNIKLPSDTVLWLQIESLE